MNAASFPRVVLQRRPAPSSRALLRPDEFRVPGSEFRVPSSEFRVPSSEFRVPSSEFACSSGFAFHSGPSDRVRNIQAGPNPEPGTLELEPGTPNTEPRTRNCEADQPMSEPVQSLRILDENLLPRRRIRHPPRQLIEGNAV